MPGKIITDHQVHMYKQHRNRHNQVASAAKAGISERSARRIDQAQSLPSQRPKRNWRTREDPLAAVWDSEVVPLLQTDVHLNAVTLLEELQRRYPGQWDSSVLRTLQRRMRLWRAQFGAEREVYFAQEHPPGRQGISDFTVADELKVKIAGLLFRHRTNLHWPTPVGATSQSLTAARASWRCPRACKQHCGLWAAHQKNTAPTASQQPSTTWLSKRK